ncbi:MAG TPA: winged helix-turn-helix transcriptional regulator [Candidatus Dojkabacteria bacterium]|nr:winged helix-turn-helix transcriptional regulator [Candidatus Dojkabacteria bacterium]
MENKFTILKPREKEVMQIIMDTQNSSGAEIGRELNMTRQNVNVIIKGLLKKGLIKKIGKNTGVRYIPS